MENQSMADIKPGRRVGNTTRQMEDAPKGAIFVWVNHHLDYPKQLAREIGRVDLKIVSPEWIEDRRWRGVELSGIVLDHAAPLTNRQWEALHEAQTRVRPADSGEGK
jgi:hypothetical protein